MLDGLEQRLLGGERKTRILSGPNRGRHMFLDRASETRMWLGRYEVAIVRELISLCEPHRQAWDVGAFVGYMTLAMARYAETVVAVEPNADNIRRLRAHIDINDVAATIVPAAVSDASGVGSLGTAAYGSMHRLGADGEGVELITLDMLVEKFGLPAVVKVDVEGAETDALRAGEQLLQARVPMVVEEHGTERRIRSIFGDHGYETRRVGNSIVAR